MWYLYLDESGDLGFDFVNKKPSKFFTVSILAISCQDANKKLFKAAKVTLRRKLNSPKDKIPFEKNNGDRVQLILDKSMAKPEIAEFNSYIRRQLEGRISPDTPLDIYHWLSHENHGLQIADLFCWGIFQKYERNNTEWFDVYKEKIRLDEQFL